MYILKEYREETVIRKSRFLACIKPVESEEEARTYIDSIKKEFRDASHVCTAYVIGAHDEIARSNDNGEPAGTAGVPMLEAIRHEEAHDICACTVRWFGGIKLGAGGLIRAYSASVSSALKHAEHAQIVHLYRYKVHYPYDLSGSLEGWLRQNTDIIDIMYDEDITATVETDLKDFKEKTAGLSNGRAVLRYLGETDKKKAV